MREPGTERKGTTRCRLAAAVALALVLAACGGGREEVREDDGPRWPADLYAGMDSGPGFNERYQDVDEESCSGAFRIENLDGTPAEAPAADLDHLFDQAKVHAFELEMTEEDWAWLRANAIKEEYVPANLLFEGRRYVGIGVRFKGGWASLLNCFDSQGNQICPKLSMKLRFDKYDPCGRFYGLRRLVFNSSRSDATLMRERLVYNLWKSVGVLASRASHAQLSVNGGAPSVFVLVEAIDEQFLVEHYDNPEGNLYKQVWPVHEVEGPYAFALRTNDGLGADVSRMVDFAKAIKNTPEEEFAAAMEPFVDLGQIAQILAVGTVIDDDDGITRFWCEDMFKPCENHNFYWYDEPDGRLRLVPWDMDITWYGFKDVDKVAPDWWEPPEECTRVPYFVFEGIEDPNPDEYQLVLPPQCDPLMRNAVKLREDAYVAMLQKLVPGIAQSIEDLEAYRTQIADLIFADPLMNAEPDTWHNDVDWLKKKMTEQLAEVEAYLASQE
jgi:hypothetical protein